MRTILLIILVLLLVGALPLWPYNTGWGYYPSGGIGCGPDHLVGACFGRSDLTARDSGFLTQN